MTTLMVGDNFLVRFDIFIAPALDEHLLLDGQVDEEADVEDEDSRRNEENDYDKMSPIHFWSEVRLTMRFTMTIICRNHSCRMIYIDSDIIQIYNDIQNDLQPQSHCLHLTLSAASSLWKNRILEQNLSASVSNFDNSFQTKTSDTFSPSKDPNLVCENDPFLLQNKEL